MVTEADSYDPLRLKTRVQKYYEHYGRFQSTWCNNCIDIRFQKGYVSLKVPT